MRLKKKMSKEKTKKRGSLRRKIAVSYLVLILLVAGISIGFMLMFLEGFIFSQTKDRLEKTVAGISSVIQKEYAGLNDRTVDRLFALLADENYSVILLDKNGCYFDGINDDYLTSYIGKNNFCVSDLALLSEDNEARMWDTGSQKYAICGIALKNEFAVYGHVLIALPLTDFGFGSNFFSFYVVSLLLASVFALLLSEILSDKMTSDIKRLKYRAELLSQRKFGVDVPITSNDEVGELADSIDIMAKSIQEYDFNQKIFLQNASHELRTPLMSIRGYVEGIKDGVFTDTDYAYDMILSQTERLEKLVDEVMYLSKVETAEGMIKLAPTPISEIIEETEMRVRGLFENKEVALKIGEIPAAMVNADCDNLSTAFTNIITNCLRFAKTEISIDVEMGDSLSVIISDDGTGINESDLPNIFKRFYKGKKGKYGLGLAIASAVAQAHAGSIKAYNKQQLPEKYGQGNTGAVFEISLPYTKILPANSKKNQ